MDIHFADGNHAKCPFPPIWLKGNKPGAPGIRAGSRWRRNRERRSGHAAAPPGTGSKCTPAVRPRFDSQSRSQPPPGAGSQYASAGGRFRRDAGAGGRANHRFHGRYRSRNNGRQGTQRPPTGQPRSERRDPAAGASSTSRIRAGWRQSRCSWYEAQVLSFSHKRTMIDST